MVVVTEMLSAHPASDVAVALLDVIADPVRWSVLARLSDTPRCECDLRAHIEIAPSLLSYHLRVLREARLVTATRRGRWIDYTLAPDAHARLAAALPTAAVAP